MDLDRLTPRQDEILRALCSGMTTAEIAEREGIRPKTVLTFRAAILTRVRAPRGATVADFCRALAERDGHPGAGPR